MSTPKRSYATNSFIMDLVATTLATSLQSFQGTPMAQASGMNSFENSHSNVISSRPTKEPNQDTTAFKNATKATKAIIFEIMPKTMGVALLAPDEAASNMEESVL